MEKVNYYFNEVDLINYISVEVLEKNKIYQDSEAINEHYIAYIERAIQNTIQLSLNELKDFIYNNKKERICY